ncbi:MAG: DUF4054 domain-containing protein [Oscillospiraceae bacterium]|nr:DUF4054 domain-containing protein [Oscillospiraceae bacterium]
MIGSSQARSIVAGASNIRGGDNPPFTVADFQAIYPQFWEAATEPGDPDADPPVKPSTVYTPYVPEDVIDMYVQMADACVKIRRFHAAWKMCMGLFIAHFLTLYMQTMAENATQQAVAAAGRTKGLMASKSVDGVSASYDFSAVMQDLDGWAAWKLTAYGVQYATLAKAYGMGGMRVS